MTRWINPRTLSTLLALGLASLISTAQESARPPGALLPNVLYGVAYYNEYMPGDQPARLDKDVALMKEAGLNVVRMGESTWSLWEPEDGHFEYAWMDRVVDAMGKAGIKVILGTPTYSIPAWMAHQHPEILADRFPAAVRRQGRPSVYGMRQNMDTDSPAYRFYAERLIRHIVAHYKDNPTSSAGRSTTRHAATTPPIPMSSSASSTTSKKKFGTPEALNKAWFLNYWGQDINTWEDMPTRDRRHSTGYKLEWSRWSRCASPTFFTGRPHWSANAPAPRQFVTTDYGGMMKRDVNEEAVAEVLDIVADNIYHGTQDHFDGSFQAHAERLHPLAEALQLPHYRNQRADHRLGPRHSSSRPTTASSAMTSTPISPTAPTWSSTGTGHSIARQSGDLLEGHSLARSRAKPRLCRDGRTAHELQKIGPRPRRSKIHNDVAILWSGDSTNAISFMPFERQQCPQDSWTRAATVRLARSAATPLALQAQRRRRLCLPRDDGLLRLQTPHRARALHRRRRSAAEDL